MLSSLPPPPPLAAVARGASHSNDGICAANSFPSKHAMPTQALPASSMSLSSSSFAVARAQHTIATSLQSKIESVQCTRGANRKLELLCVALLTGQQKSLHHCACARGCACGCACAGVESTCTRPRVHAYSVPTNNGMGVCTGSRQSYCTVVTHTAEHSPCRPTHNVGNDCRNARPHGCICDKVIDVLVLPFLRHSVQEAQRNLGARLNAMHNHQC